MGKTSREWRRQLIETAPQELSLRRCCELLGLNRSTLYYKEKPADIDDIDLLNAIRDVWERLPFYGYRRITKLSDAHIFQRNCYVTNILYNPSLII